MSVIRGDEMLDNLNYKYVLDQLFDGIYIVDNDRKIVFWNEGAKRISGFSSEEVLGRYCHDNILNHVDENGINLCLNGCPLYQTMQDGEQREMVVYLQHKKGYRLPVKIRSFPIYDNGEIVASVEIFSEDTEKNHFHRMYKGKEFKDELTNLPNRKMIDHYLAAKMNEYQELGVSFGVIMTDIDSFEELNNTYGVNICDKVIKILAETYRTSFRMADMVGRWREDEFIFILTGINHEGLKMLAEKIRMISENSSLRGETFKDVEVTVSVGATIVNPTDDITVLTSRSYKLMKRSKSRGGNFVTIK